MLKRTVWFPLRPAKSQETWFRAERGYENCPSLHAISFWPEIKVGQGVGPCQEVWKYMGEGFPTGLFWCLGSLVLCWPVSRLGKWQKLCRHSPEALELSDTWRAFVTRRGHGRVASEWTFDGESSNPTGFWVTWRLLFPRLGFLSLQWPCMHGSIGDRMQGHRQACHRVDVHFTVACIFTCYWSSPKGIPFEYISPLSTHIPRPPSSRCVALHKHCVQRGIMPSGIGTDGFTWRSSGVESLNSVLLQRLTVFSLAK